MRKLYESFIQRSVRARIGIIIAFVLLLVFCFYIIKANMFNGNSSTEIISEITAETAEAATAEVTESEPLQFHIGILDIVLLVGAFTAYGIHKFREKKREERVHK